MSVTKQQTTALIDDDVYDDGYLRVEHKNYYVVVRRPDIETAAH